jgi:hypothetical protein
MDNNGRKVDPIQQIKSRVSARGYSLSRLCRDSWSDISSKEAKELRSFLVG